MTVQVEFIEPTTAPVVFPHEIEQSLYRPYKQWSVDFQKPQERKIKVILIKRERQSCIAACPELGLRCESEDYLSARFELARQIKTMLQLGDEASFVGTCVAPFHFGLVEHAPLEPVSPIEIEKNTAMPTMAGNECMNGNRQAEVSGDEIGDAENQMDLF